MGEELKGAIVAEMQVEVTVRSYSINGQFLDQEPGKDKSLQRAFRERIGDLPNSILDLAVGIYDVQVMNNQIVIYFMSAIVPTQTLDDGLGDVLNQAVEDGKLVLRPHAYGIFKGVTTHQQRVSNERIIKRLRQEAAKAIVHFLNMADSCSSPATKGDYHLLVRACIADLLVAIPQVV